MIVLYRGWRGGWFHEDLEPAPNAVRLIEAAIALGGAAAGALGLTLLSWYGS